jgi:hypothetical protein
MIRQAYDELAANGIQLDILYGQEGMRVTSGRALRRRDPDRAEFLVTTRPGTLAAPTASYEKAISTLAR